MKTAAERGHIGAWAYEARQDADLSVEEVVERLTRMGQPVTPPTLRGIEAGSKKPSRRLLRSLATVYDRPVPGEPEPSEQTESLAEYAVLIAAQTKAIEAQTAAIEAQTKVAERQVMLMDALLQRLGEPTETERQEERIESTYRALPQQRPDRTPAPVEP